MTTDFDLTSVDKLTIIKRKFRDGSEKFRLAMGTDYNKYTYEWSNFVIISEYDNIEDARRARDKLISSELVSEEIVC